MVTWVLVTDMAVARLYQISNLRTEQLRLVQDYVHAEGRMQRRDITTDKPGHYKSDSGGRGSYEKGDPKKIEAEIFAQNLIKDLKTKCNFDIAHSVVIVAPPSMYKFIKKHLHLSNIYQNKVTYIMKDYIKYSDPLLLDALKKHLLPA